MKNFTLKALAKTFFLIYIPFIILSIIGWFLIPDKIDFIKEIIAFGMLSFIILLIFILINNKKLKSVFYLISSFFLLILIIIKLSFYYHFNAKLSSSVFYIIYETNKVEASEFFNYYMDGKLLVFYFLVFILYLYLMKVFVYDKKKIIINDVLNFKLKNTLLKLSLILLIPFLSFLIVYKLSDENLIVKSYLSIKEYHEIKSNFKETIAKNYNNNLEITSFKKEPQTYVIIVGESTSSWHMQLYGYERDTNPLLSKINNELIVFKNIKTPNVHTISALEKILTLTTTKQKPQKNKNESIIQLANQAEFTTYWVSNQRPVGINESIPSLIGNAADYKYFLNTKDYSSKAYDEILLPTFDSILNDSNKKRIIFLHLMGTHGMYRYRYPKEFNHYKGYSKQTKFKHQRALNLVNQYDNAVRYNDSIVRTIIDKIKSKDLNSFVLYFSDHGDEVFDTIDWSGHNGSKATDPMYDVPLILWTSKKYKDQNPFINKLNNVENKKYNLEHFIHSYSDLTQIKFKEYKKNLSLFNN